MVAASSAATRCSWAPNSTDTDSTVDEYRYVLVSDVNTRTGPFVVGGTASNGAVFTRLALAATDAVTMSIGLRGDFWKTDPLLATDPREGRVVFQPARRRRLSCRRSHIAAGRRVPRAPHADAQRALSRVPRRQRANQPEFTAGARDADRVRRRRALFARAACRRGSPRLSTRSTARSPTSRSVSTAPRSCASDATRTRFAPPASSSRPTCALHPTVTSQRRRRRSRRAIPRIGRHADAGGQSRAAGAERAVRRGRDLGGAQKLSVATLCAAAAVSSTTISTRPAFELNPYAVLDFSVSRPIARSLQAFFSVENLFDEDYDTGRTPLRTIGWPRTIRVGVRFALP